MGREAAKLWKRLDDKTKSAVLDVFVRTRRDDGWPEGLADDIAKTFKGREITVLRAEDDQLAGLVRKAALVDDAVAASLLIEYHVAGREDLLSGIYDVMGIEHDGVHVDADVLNAPFESDPPIDEILELTKAHGFDDVILCFKVMELVCSQEWRPTVSRIVETLKEDVAPETEAGPTAQSSLEQTHSDPDEISDPDGSTTSSRDGDSEDHQEHPEISVEPVVADAIATPEFSNLDILLIETVVSTLIGIQGSLSKDKVDDLINETLQLNRSRTQSYFHRGFFDALMSRQRQAMGPGENKERRAWYLCGFALGRKRLSGNETKAAADVFLELKRKDKRTLIGSPAQPAGAMLVQHIVRPLLEGGHIKEAEGWIGRYLSAASPDVVAGIIEWAGETLVSGDPEDVCRVLDYCDKHPAIAAGGNRELPRLMVRDLKRRLAIALRVTGHMAQAENMLDDLIESERDPSRRSNLLGNQVLTQIGIQTVESLRIGKPDTREALVASIQSVEGMIREGTENIPLPSPILLLVSAIPAIVEPGKGMVASQLAIANLQQAIVAMERWTRPLWEAKGVLKRARFYLSLAQLRVLDHALAAPAVNRLLGLMEEGLDEPRDLIVDAINHAMIQEAPGGSRLAREAIRLWPQEMLRNLDIESFVRRSPEFRGAVVDALDSNRNLLTTPERWQAWRCILSGALTAAERDVELAGRALDELETLAERDGCAGEFAGLLADKENWDPAWTGTEADYARFRVLISAGETDNACPILYDIAHRLISQGDPEAIGVVETLELYGQPEDSVAHLRSRLADAGFTNGDAGCSADDQADEGSPVRVLFIGGNETQAAYRDRLIRSFAETHPNCKVEFEFPGWGSNWGRVVDTYKGRMFDADVVVLMRLMRTHLGRTLRKAVDDAGIPWVACPGHGRKSLRRSIKNAIEVARRLKKNETAAVA